MSSDVKTIQGGARGLRIVALCLAVAAAEGFDSQAAGVAAPKLAPLLQLTPHQIGLVFSSATVGMMVGGVIGGIIADRHGRRFSLILSLVAFGVFTYATAYAWNFEVLSLIRFVTGLGLGGALPGLVAIAAEAVEPKRRGAAVGIVYAGIPIGAALASAASIVFENWQSLFVFGAILPLLLIPPLVMIIPSSRPVGTQPREKTNVKLAGGILDKENRLASVLLWTAFFLSGLVLFLLLNWQPVLLVSKGFTGSGAGAVQVAFNLAAALGSVLAGFASDTYRRRLAVIASVGLLLAALLYLAILPPYLPLAVLAGAALGAGVASGQAILFALAAQAYPEHIRGTGVGFGVGMARFGSVVGPLLAGVLIASGRAVNEVFIVLVPIAFVGGLASFFLVVFLERRKSRSTIIGSEISSVSEDKLGSMGQSQRSV